MTDLVTDERPHCEAVGAAIRAGIPETAGEIVFEYGQAPGDPGNADPALREATPPDVYVLFSIERRQVADITLASSTTVTGWRITARYVGKTIREAQWAGAKVADGLQGTRLLVGGTKTTRIKHESTTAVIPDEGLFSGSTTWTYAH